MGSISSKLTAKETDSSTPLKTMPPRVIVDGDQRPQSIETNLLDPRSPHVCRTPLNESINTQFPITKNLDLTEIETPAKQTDQGLLLRSMLIRELNYNLFDPRSPSQFIDRTPIAFSEDDRPVYVDFDETSVRPAVEEPAVVEPAETNPETPKLEVTPVVSGERDPRSPSEGVERTPIVFADEISQLENLDGVMEKLAVNGIENKPLERVKNRPRSRTVKKAAAQWIYEDEIQRLTTPPKRCDGATTTPKRTPLSCVANKSHLRSKSVENSSTKSMKNRLPLSSYDDYSLKPDNRNGCLSGESFQLMSPRVLNI